MCLAIHTITFACACTIKHPKAEPIAIEPCVDMLPNYNGVICPTWAMRPAIAKHFPVTCYQHMLASFQAAIGAKNIYRPKKTSFETIMTWYHHKDSTFSEELTDSITSQRIECFLAMYHTEEARESLWDMEVMQPMFGYEYVTSKDPTKRGWKRFVGVEEGAATLLKTKREVEKARDWWEGRKSRSVTRWRRAEKLRR